MGQFISLVAMSLSTGVVLAALACWLSTTRGNRMSELKQSDVQAIDIQVMNHFKIATSVPIVALYVVSVACAIGLPSYFIYVNRLDTQVIGLEGTFDVSPQQLVVTPENLHVYGNNFHIPIAVTKLEQLFDVNAGKAYAPLTLQTHVIAETKQLYYYINGQQKYGPFDIDGSAAHVGAIHLSRVPSAAGVRDGRLSAASQAPRPKNKGI